MTDSMPTAIYWLQHPKRRKYRDIGFFPGRDVPNEYNLWRGFAVEPRPGDCSKFLAHLKDNACKGDAALYAWVEAWFADIFQHPDKKCGTALAFRGKQGVGKTKIGKVIRSLIGKAHSKAVSDPATSPGDSMPTCSLCCCSMPTKLFGRETSRPKQAQGPGHRRRASHRI